MPFEINLFGPGYGESIAVKIGPNDWMIIDSCIDESGSPAPTAYLSSRGIPLEEVKLVVASHWHDDHVRGFSEVVRMCTNAKVVMGHALTRKEFHAFVLAHHDERSKDKMSSGTSELYKVLKILQERKTPGMKASPDRRIWTSTSENGEPIEVWSLSPSDACSGRFMSFLSTHSAAPGVTRMRAPTIKENETAVAMLVSCGDVAVLLGADLEESHSGWSDILSSTGRPKIKSSLFKIPHHGSENGHHEGVWSDMLQHKPISIMTPYNKGYKLPKDTDTQRIIGLSDKAFMTRKIMRLTQVTRDSSVDKMIKNTVRSIQPIDKRTGHIRAYWDSSEKWIIELNKGAYELSA